MHSIYMYSIEIRVGMILCEYAFLHSGRILYQEMTLLMLLFE